MAIFTIIAILFIIPILGFLRMEGESYSEFHEPDENFNSTRSCF